MNCNEKKDALVDSPIVLSERDFAHLMAATQHPAPPGARLKAAAQEYNTVRHAHPELNW